MRNKITYIVMFPIVLIALCISCLSCDKENDNDSDNKGSNTGKVVFWSYDDYGYITVKVDGIEVGKITSNFSNGTPECGENTCLTVTLKEGEHEYEAKCNYVTWKDDFDVKGGSCKAVKLDR